MKNAIIALMLGFLSFPLFAQNNDLLQLQNKVTSLENANAKLSGQVHSSQKSITDLTNQLKTANETIVGLQAALAASNTRLDEVTGAIDQRIMKTEQDSSEKIDHLGKSLSMNTIYWVIAFLIVGFISYFLYRKLRGRLSKEKAAIYNEIKSANEQLKMDFSALITRNTDDIKYMYTGELKDLGNNNKKSLDNLKSEIETKITVVTETMEARINALKQAKPKASKPQQPKAEIS